MEILVIGIQLLSFGLLVFGAGLCVWVTYRDWEDADEQRAVRSQPAGGEADMETTAPG